LWASAHNFLLFNIQTFILVVEEYFINKPYNMMIIKTVGLACDHAGYPLMQFVKSYLEKKDIPYKDFGTYSEDSCDYSDFGHLLGRAIDNDEVYPGIGICGSGEGISMTLNHHPKVRAGLCWIPEIAHLIRQHNDANCLVMPGRFIDTTMAEKILDEFFNTDFEGGRHLRRISKIPLDK
jgi:ribose 5-phosphate isomerase B